MKIKKNRLNSNAAMLETRIYLDGEDEIVISADQTQKIEEVAAVSSAKNVEAGRVFDSKGGATGIITGTFSSLPLGQIVFPETTQTVHTHPSLFRLEKDVDGTVAATNSGTVFDLFNGDGDPNFGDPHSSRDFLFNETSGTDGFVQSSGETFFAKSRDEGLVSSGTTNQDVENLQQRARARRDQDERNAVMAFEAQDGNRPDQQPDAGTSENVEAGTLTPLELREALLDGKAGEADVLNQDFFAGFTAGNADGSTTLKKLDPNYVSSDSPLF